MAGEITYSSILTNQRLAEVLGSEYLLQLADRNALPNHPALIYAGDAAGRGSVVMKLPTLGLMGYDLMQPTGDGSAVANTSMTDGKVTVTVARYSKSYEATDLARISDPGAVGGINPTMFAQDAIQTQALTLTNLICNVTDDFTSTVGSTGVDLSVANFMSAIQTLEVAKVAPPYMCILSPQQVGDLRYAIGTVTAGAVQWLPASQAQLSVLGGGYRGQWLGVDIFSSAYVPTANAGADYAGGMFGRGGVVWGDASIPPEGDPNQMLIGNKVLFERVRTGKAGLTAFVSHAYLGVTKGLSAAGVSIITDY